MLPVSGFAQTGSQNVSPIQEQPATLPLGKANEGLKPQEWEDLEISFLSEERVQIMIGDQTETRNYGELGFMDKRGGKPNQAWGLRRTLAMARVDTFRIQPDVRTPMTFWRWVSVSSGCERHLWNTLGFPQTPCPSTRRKATAAASRSVAVPRSTNETIRSVV